MLLKRNFLAGLANSSWSIIVSFVAVPFYLKYLGIGAYGLIGFFITLQALLSMLDMGMTPTINREVARCSAMGNISEAGKLLHSLAFIYWIVAIVIAAFMLLLSSWISEYWIESSQLSPKTISNAIILMGIVVAFRWPTGLYQGALIGAQRLVLSSAINMVIVTIGTLGGVGVVVFISPTIEAFFIWHACVAFVFAIVVRTTAWRIIGKLDSIRFDLDKLKSVWRFAAGMSGVALSGIILMQLDKVLLSKILSLEDFGRYSLAAVVASGLYVFLTPLFNTIYPRMSSLVAQSNTKELINLYRTGALLFLSLFFPIAISVGVFAEDVIHLWTGDKLLAISLAPITLLFLIGTALNGVMHFPYALQLAYGKTQIPLIINLVLIFIMVPTITLFATSYGVVGGAAAWALTNIIYVLFGTLLTHRSLLKGIGITWLFGDVMRPLAMAALIVGVGGVLFRGFEFPNYINILFGAGLVCISFLFMFLISLRLRIVVKSILNNDVSGNILI